MHKSFRQILEIRRCRPVGWASKPVVRFSDGLGIPSYDVFFAAYFGLKGFYTINNSLNFNGAYRDDELFCLKYLRNPPPQEMQMKWLQIFQSAQLSPVDAVK